MPAKVGVVLSGCGYLDGAEIQEAVLTLYFLDRAGIEVQCYAPDRPQMHVVDHRSGEATEGSRNVLLEAARICRGQVLPLADAAMSGLDALVLPGGYGVAKNLSDFAVKGVEGSVDADLVRVIDESLAAKKPILAMCISPAVLALALKGKGRGVTVTIGQDTDTAAAVEALGARHQNCDVSEVAVDADLRVVSTPAYMLEKGPAAVASGIEAAVAQLVDWLG